MRYIRVIALLLFMSLVMVPVHGQKKREAVPLVAPAYRGVSVNLDVAAPFMGLAIDNSVVNIEAMVDVNLYNRFFPIVEVGYGSINQTIENGANYKGSAPFWRLGINFNLSGIPDKVDEPALLKHYAYVGLRYGMSSVTYSMHNVPYYDDFWQESADANFQGRGVYVGWAELVAGVKLDVARGFTMGWSVALKGLIHTSAPSKAYVWYVPGYGKSANSNFTFRYTVGYTLNYKPKTAKTPAVEP